MIKDADISKCGEYRYTLSRVWDNGLLKLMWVMLNPSTADAFEDDPTIRRCIGFAKDWGYGGIYVVNLFAFRSPSPKTLREAADPIGADNDRYLLQSAVRSDMGGCVFAWGAGGALYERGDKVASMFPHAMCLGKTKHGHPRHPLYVPGNTPLRRFKTNAGEQKAEPARKETP